MRGHKVITLTDAAASKAATLRIQEQHSSSSNPLVLRIAVQPGGCAGLRYELYFDTNLHETDLSTTYTTEGGDLVVVVDSASAPYLEEATVDYVERIDKIGFVVDNPSASTGCACGDSFC
jgi:iron-sulfur cluster assembly accessory protein